LEYGNRTNYWCNLDKAEVLQALQTSEDGLAEAEVGAPQQSYGLNEFPRGIRTSLLKIVFHQLLSPLIFILLLAALASLLIGEFSDALFIGLSIS